MALPNDTPLAFRLRPTTLEEFVGQDHVVGQGSVLRTAIESDTLSSVILSGPPGTGKTTLARIAAERTKAHFVQVNAVLSGVKELREVCAGAEQLFTGLKRRTLLFIDEIHRFNKSQQDALLPYVESGSVILIGATTENPYFEVNPALVSRSQIVMLTPLAQEHLLSILHRALTDERGLSGRVHVEEKALEKIALLANGDARIALNLLEMAVLTAGKSLTISEIDALFRERGKRYDQTGEEHYNSVSAFIKSMRGSDCDAALLWMFKMLAGGEQPRFLFRRMAIFASEDVGNADPHALSLVVAAWKAFELVGQPEGEFFLAHACIYLSQAPKSNAIARAMSGARDTLRSAPALEVPMHLRNAPIKGMADQGCGRGYQYPHDDAQGVVAAHYFPIDMSPRTFYEPTQHGFEQEVRERLRHVRQIIGR